MFNGDVKVAAMAVASPLDAQDVSQSVTNVYIGTRTSSSDNAPSRTVIFCQKHSLSISIKAGGYGTAGWAVGGDIIVDLSQIVQADIESPKDDGTFTSIRDMSPPGSKGKERAAPTLDTAASGKRRREDDATLRVYSSSSEPVQTFLHPSGITEPFRPTNRRRLDDSLEHDDAFPQVPASLTTPKESVPDDSASAEQSMTCGVKPTSPPPPISHSATADPFGYLDDDPDPIPQLVPSTSQRVQYLPGSMFASPTFLASQQNILTYATPVHSHAYVTFGAGMRQKEVDQFCAANPLEAQSLAGGRSAVPYHIPL